MFRRFLILLALSGCMQTPADNEWAFQSFDERLSWEAAVAEQRADAASSEDVLDVAGSPDAPDAPGADAEVAPCVPNCDGRECGDDGCQGVCGQCVAAAPKCSSVGKCVIDCTPKCDQKECGNDGCGGQCGKCPDAAPICTPQGFCAQPTVWCDSHCGQTNVSAGCYCDAVCTTFGDCCTSEGMAPAQPNTSCAKSTCALCNGTQTAGWPLGSGNPDTDALGDLVDANHDLTVAPGQTVVLPSLGIYDFRNLTVMKGGTLKLSADAGGWTFIGVARACTLDGQVVARSGEYAGTVGSAAAVKAPGPDGTATGESVSWFVSQQSGGSAANSGGQGLFGNGGGSGGASYSDCNGAGGIGGQPGQNASEPNGGNGGNSHAGPGGVGAASYDSKGGDGANGGGGGGGHRGRHGQLLYLKVGGALVGSGVIDASGTAGTAGGTSNGGGNCGNNQNCVQLPGTGGGGGAGGSGGAVVLRAASVPSTLNVNVGGGPGGSGGAGAWCSGGNGGNGGGGIAGCFNLAPGTPLSCK